MFKKITDWFYRMLEQRAVESTKKILQQAYNKNKMNFELEFIYRRGAEEPDLDYVRADLYTYDRSKIPDGHVRKKGDPDFIIERMLRKKILKKWFFIMDYYNRVRLKVVFRHGLPGVTFLAG